VTEDFSAKIEIQTNSKGATQSIQETTNALKQLNKYIEKTDELQKKNFKSVGEWDNQTKRVYNSVFKLNQVEQNYSRNYANASVLYDQSIKSREQSGKIFAAGLKERLQLQQQEVNQLPRLAYALYDVGYATGAVASGFAAAAIASIKFAADYETAFTAVERTTLSTGGTLELLKNQLLSLSTEVPASFSELSNIASIGAQLGIASSDLAGFTKNVAMFSSTTNVSVDEAAKSFGALGQLLGVPTSEYNKLGSAISYVGVRSVATESEILSVAKNLGGVANQAGLSAQFVIGLSGALASLRVPAEQSRGALTRIFQEINRASIEGGSKLQAFANILGITASEAKNLATQNPQQFFQDLLKGLSSLDSAGLTQALDAMNLSDIRVTNTLTRLSKNLPMVNEALANSNEAYASGTFLAQAYGYKIDDLASRFTIFQNSLMEVGAAFGEAITPETAFVLDSISNSLNLLADALRTDAGQALASMTLNVFGVVAALGTLLSVSLLATASMTRLKTVMITGGWAETATGLRGVTAALFGVGVAGETAGRGIKVLKYALISTGIGLAIVALGELAAAFAETSASADDTFSRYINDTSGLADAINADITSYRDARIAGDQELLASYVTVKGVTEGASQDQIDYQTNLRDTAEVLGIDVPNAFAASNDAITGNTRLIGDNTTAWIRNSLISSDAFKKLMDVSTFNGETFANTLQGLRFDFDTFTKVIASQGEKGGVNYFQDLAIEAARAGRITAGQLVDITNALATGNTAFASLIKLVLGYTNAISVLELPDSVKTKLEEVGDTAEKAGDQVGGFAAQVRTLVDYANDLSSTFQRAFDIRWKAILDADATADSWDNLSQRINDARNRILGLTNTRDKLEYFLSIAVAAGDTMRINELTAELAAANADLASATDDASTELNGNTAAARRNRRELLAIIQSNAQYLASLAASGTSQSELARIAGQLNTDFMDQALALGYSSDEASALATSFGDLTTIINNIPPNITVGANANPALQALNEFIAKANASSATVTITSKINGDANAAQIQYLQALFDGKKALNLQQISLKNYAGAIKTADEMAAYAASINDLGGKVVYASGGYTGRGGKYEPAGIVHKGEYVVPKSMVNQSTGLPHADALGRLVAGSAPATSGYASGGLVSGGMMVSLSPDDRALLRGIGASGDIVVAVDSREIARANAHGARLVTAEGGYLL